MKWLSLLFLVCILFSSCVPSDMYVQTAIAETEMARPTDTIEVEPTIPLSPTSLPSETPSITPTETSTLSPTTPPTETPTLTATPDTRIILGDPEDYILQKEDFPDDYILQSGDSTPHLNEEILSARGIEDGKAYLNATGRTGGWIIYYTLADPTAIAPEWIRSYVVMYDNVDGPDITVSSDYDVIYDDFEVSDVQMDLGEWSRVTVSRVRQSSGKNRVWYVIEYIYKNVWAEVMGYGFESDVRHDYLENLARIMLEKLENAPLGVPKIDNTNE